MDKIKKRTEKRKEIKKRKIGKIAVYLNIINEISKASISSARFSSNGS